MRHLATVIDELLSPQPWTIDEVMDRHFSPDFSQRVQGIWVERASFAAHIVELRQSVERATITVLDELALDDHYAERHVIDLRMWAGERVVREVFVFARLDPDGRFRRIEEVTLEIAPKCWVPYDHWPIRSWPLYRARQVMREVLSNPEQRSTT